MNLRNQFARGVLRWVFLFQTWGMGTSAPASPALPSNPPWLPDRYYVANGCYISATAYLMKLKQLYPDLNGWTANVLLPSGNIHTLAIVRWDTRLFLRDTSIGVAEIHDDVQQSFETAACLRREKGGWHFYPKRRPHSPVERLREIELAARLLGFADPKVICARSATGPVSVLSWKTAGGELAVYEPSHGTAVGPGDVAVADVVTHVFSRFVPATH